MSERTWAFEAAQLMAAIVENSEDAIISGTLDGTISSWNPAAERMYGYSSAEIIGKSAAVLSAKGRVGETRAILARIGGGDQVERVETTRVRKDGTTISVSLTFSPICHPDGTIVGVSTIARDLTERQQAARDAMGLTAAQDLVHTMGVRLCRHCPGRGGRLLPGRQPLDVRPARVRRRVVPGPPTRGPGTP